MGDAAASFRVFAGDSMSPTPLDDSETKRRFGKYRGLVIDNLDPLQIGRIPAQVPDVLGETPSSWALPCIPAAGSQAGCFIVPPIGSQVWIEFEQGDPDYPIWTGGFWGLVADVPVAALTPAPIPPGQNIVLQTTGQNALILSDAPPSPVRYGFNASNTRFFPAAANSPASRSVVLSSNASAQLRS